MDIVRRKLMLVTIGTLRVKPLHFGRSLAYELGARFSKGPVTFLAPNCIFKSKCKE